MEVDPSPVVVPVGEYSVLKFAAGATPFEPAPNVTSTQGNKRALQPEGFSQLIWPALQSSCYHI
jgi:hypothetical protein